MGKLKCTPGPWEVENMTDVFGPLGGDSGAGLIADGYDAWQVADCCGGKAVVDGELKSLDMYVATENASLIAEAGTVYHETGMTPRELVERIEELEIALRKVVTDSEIGIVPKSHLEYIKEILDANH